MSWRRTAISSTACVFVHLGCAPKSHTLCRLQASCKQQTALGFSGLAGGQHAADDHVPASPTANTLCLCFCRFAGR